MKFARFLLAFLPVFVRTLAESPQPIDSKIADMPGFITKQLEIWKTPGVSVAIVRGTKFCSWAASAFAT